MTKKKLTDKQKIKRDYADLSYEHGLFLLYYLTHEEYQGNGTMCYMLVYPESSYQAASVSACQLLRNPKIRKYVGKLKEKYEIDIERIIEEDKCLAFSDIGEIFDEDGSLISPKQLPENVRRSISSVEVIEKKLGNDEDSLVVERTYKYKFWDKVKAEERLGKFMKMYTDKVEHSGKISFDHMSDEELDSLVDNLSQETDE